VAKDIDSRLRENDIRAWNDIERHNDRNRFMFTNDFIIVIPDLSPEAPLGVVTRSDSVGIGNLYFVLVRTRLRSVIMYEKQLRLYHYQL
jgi:hypothetical protein